MSKMVWKFEFNLARDLSYDDTITLAVPAGARVLSWDARSSVDIRMWAEVDPFPSRYEDLVFYVVGTGQPVPEDGEYLATVIAGEYIWHIYKKKEG